MSEQPGHDSILWRRLDLPGHEAVRLTPEGSAWQLTGAAVFASDEGPCKLDYTVLCDALWQTRWARVTGWAGARMIELDLTAEAGVWQMNGVECPDVAGAVDIDLNFSPSTNLLPIRRLQLAVGQHAAVRAAWLEFPTFVLKPLDQIYRRTGEATYRYESADGAFVRDLQVNSAGFVTSYPGSWQIE